MKDIFIKSIIKGFGESIGSIIAFGVFYIYFTKKNTFFINRIHSFFKSTKNEDEIEPDLNLDIIDDTLNDYESFNNEQDDEQDNKEDEELYNDEDNEDNEDNDEEDNEEQENEDDNKEFKYNIDIIDSPKGIYFEHKKKYNSDNIKRLFNSIC